MGSGLARGAAARGKRVAFGDGRRIIWKAECTEIYRHNPNVAPPGSEDAADLEWVEYYPRHRIYTRRLEHRRWWNPDWRAPRGEIFFDDAEKRFSQSAGENFILIEPNLPFWKSTSPNKDWGFQRYQKVADLLRADGFEVVQLGYRDIGRHQILSGVRTVKSLSFRHGLSVLSRAAAYLGPEGGLHHGAAAVGTKAVVLFGGFISPQSTGYEMHTNMFTGGEACGSLNPCAHCRAALDAITIEEVCVAVKSLLRERA